MATLGLAGPTAFAHFVCLCHVLVILAIFQAFSITVIFAMMIYDQWLQSAESPDDD